MGLFGPDKLTLMLERYDYKPGDTIKGTITLNLKKPTQARKLEVGLIGIQTIYGNRSGVRVGSSRHRSSNTSREVIYDFYLALDQEKEYQNQNYRFEMKIPENILQSQSKSQQFQDTLEEKLGTIGRFIGGMNVHQGPISWEVTAQLDIPLKLDVKKTQDIVISP